MMNFVLVGSYLAPNLRTADVSVSVLGYDLVSALISLVAALLVMTFRTQTLR
jgi:hypothetical protein